MLEREIGKTEFLPSSRQLLNPRVPLPWWLGAIVVIGSVLMLAGAVVAILHPALLVSPHAEINDAVRVYAGYLFSRNLALAIMLFGAMILRARGMLNSLMLFAALVQLLDAAVDFLSGRWPILPGVIVLGLLFLVGSARLSGYPFWRIEAWKQSL